MVKYIMWTLIALLSAGGWYANKVWKEFQPTLEVLKEKDPDKFSVMMAEARDFHLEVAKTLYVELEQMTKGQVIALRYQKWKDKRKEDKEFRLDSWQKQLDARELTRQEKKIQYQASGDELIAARTEADDQVWEATWDRMESWQKGMVLREKCVKFTEMERKKNLEKTRALDLTRTAALLEKPASLPWTTAELCASYVPFTRDGKMVDVAIETLKNRMNYYYFVKLLDEIGLPQEEIIPFSKRLEHMARDFSDS